MHLNRIRVGASRFERVNRPHCEVAHEHKRDHLAARLASGLVGRVTVTSGRVEYERRLKCGLKKTRDCID